MPQVCAEGDNEFAESIAELSVMKDSSVRGLGVPIGLDERNGAVRKELGV